MKRIVTLTCSIILLTILLIVLGDFISRSVANHKADEFMRPAFDEGWVRQKTFLGLWIDGNFQPMWVVEYNNTNPAVFVDFGPQFAISPFGAIIYTSPRDLAERIRRNKLKVEQSHPPDRVPPPIKWTLSTNDKEGVHNGEKASIPAEAYVSPLEK